MDIVHKLMSYYYFVGLDLNESRSSHVLLIAAVSSSVVAFLVISISVLTLAAGSYYFVRRRCKQLSSSNQPTEPLYEDVPTAVEHQEQGLELTENVAYGYDPLVLT
jgi:hypothetical protein